MTDDGHGGHIQGLEHRCAATSGTALAASLSTVPVEECDPDQGRQLAAVEASRLRPFGNEHGGHDGTDIQYAAQPRGPTGSVRMALQAVPGSRFKRSHSVCSQSKWA